MNTFRFGLNVVVALGVLIAIGVATSNSLLDQRGAKFGMLLIAIWMGRALERRFDDYLGSRDVQSAWTRRGRHLQSVSIGSVNGLLLGILAAFCATLFTEQPAYLLMTLLTSIAVGAGLALVYPEHGGKLWV